MNLATAQLMDPHTGFIYNREQRRARGWRGPVPAWLKQHRDSERRHSPLRQLKKQSRRTACTTA